MKTNCSRALIAGVLLSIGSFSIASPLQRAELPAEPVWVLHVDCDALRPTAIGQYILSEMDKPEAAAKLAAFQALFNVDLRKQVHGLTLYGLGSAQQDGVALIHADFDSDRLVTMAKAAKEYQAAEHRTHVIHNWIDDNKKAKNGVKPRTYAAIYAGRIVIFGQRQDRVAEALDVLDRLVPNLATSKALPQMGAPGDTSFLQAAARKLDLPASDPNAAVFRLAKLVRLQAGEAQDKVFATLTLEANSEEIAGNMISIVQGLVSLMKLQQDKPETVKLANSIALKQEGQNVVASLVLPSGEVVEIMKADAARKAARKGQKE